MRIAISLIILLSAGCASAPEDSFDVLFRFGDNTQWSQPEWEDTDWTRSSLTNLPDSAGIIWLRFTIATTEVTTLGLGVTGAVAREVYWDGVFIGRAGRVGFDFDSELPGPIDAVFRIPDSLSTPGDHSVAVRMSSFRRPPRASGLLMNIYAGELTALTTAPLRSVGIPLLFLGSFVIIAIYYGALFLGDRLRLPYLFTALLCLSVSLLLVAESWRPAIGYTYDLHATRLAIVDVFTGAVGLLLALTFALQFSMGRMWLFLGVLLALLAGSLLFVPDHETGTFIAFTISLLAALAITGGAALQGKAEARFAFIGVAICLLTLVATGYQFMERAFFPAFSVLIAGLLTSLGLQIRNERRQHARTLATAARLENELIKKQIQPHFLMNTLTSIIEWVETSPRVGVKAIEALAVELRVLNDISGEKRISMKKELDLCRAHLVVMGYRQDVLFELDAEGVDVEGTIPPAVIHTLVENGITHNAYSEGDITFILREEKKGRSRHLTLKTPMEGAPEEGRPEGSGLQYVRSRLEEAYPGAWCLDSGQEQGDWVTHIEFTE